MAPKDGFIAFPSGTIMDINSVINRPTKSNIIPINYGISNLLRYKLKNKLNNATNKTLKFLNIV